MMGYNYDHIEKKNGVTYYNLAGRRFNEEKAIRYCRTNMRLSARDTGLFLLSLNREYNPKIEAADFLSRVKEKIAMQNAFCTAHVSKEARSNA